MPRIIRREELAGFPKGLKKKRERQRQRGLRAQEAGWAARSQRAKDPRAIRGVKISQTARA